MRKDAEPAAQPSPSLAFVTSLPLRPWQCFTLLLFSLFIYPPPPRPTGATLVAGSLTPG